MTSAESPGGADLTAKYQVGGHPNTPTYSYLLASPHTSTSSLTIFLIPSPLLSFPLTSPHPPHQKLATEYAKLRAQSAVIKKGLLEEQDRSTALQDQVCSSSSSSSSSSPSSSVSSHS